VQHSGEQAVPVIEALAGLCAGGEFVVNVPNEGQIQGVPAGSLVECMVAIDREGMHPRPASPLPTAVLAWVQTHIAAQELVVGAALEGRPDLALQALLLDPLCHRLSRAEATELLRALVAHNVRFAPAR
jgi:alpha-galactosidase